MSPALKTMKEVASILRSMADSVEAGDSFEGNIEYGIEGPDKLGVVAVWRVGNSMGQGGCIMIGDGHNDT